ncbi:ABC transporter permease subunit [Deinococcus sp.]|uniref:ABC transporter permease n=1 Tax=Deinococcus sp. TaxID=47478 RepID=UPI0025D89E59|nr:ABC transporter permease subunit [Deinococcus sp.]
MQERVRSGGVGVRPIRESRWRRSWQRYTWVYLMLVPVLLYYAVFEYGPLYGLIIAFKDYSPAVGIGGSPWVGWQWFHEFFGSFYFWRVLRNTLMINVWDLLFGFTAPILLALLLNEVTSTRFRRFVQTMVYLPHFISIVVISGLVLDLFAQNGLINDILVSLGGTRTAYMSDPGSFQGIYVGSGIWQSVGWGSIIYLAALAGINPSLYEAARVDGAGRWHLVRHVTLPGMMPTIITLLILRIGQMMSVGFEKIILLYNPSTYETADVISTTVYRRGLLEANFSYGAAVGLFNAVIALALLLLANRLSRTFTGSSLW